MTGVKIIFVAKEIRGGTHTFLKQISRLNNQKFKKYFYLFRRDRLSVLRGDVYYSNDKYPDDENPSFQKALIFVKNLNSLNKIVVQKGPAILFACDFYSFILLAVYKVLFRSNVTFIYFINIPIDLLINRKPNSLYRNLLLWISKRFLNVFDLVIPCSYDLADHLIKTFNLNPQNIYAIPYGIDLERVNFRMAQRLTNEKGPGFKILSVGRFDKQKDFETILKAFELLIKRNNNATLYLVGDGPLRRDLQKEAERLGIGQRTFFLGWKKNTVPYLKSSDLFVFSSFYEGFGMVILEAMAVRIPVVATDTPFGPSEILNRGEYGILVPIGDYKRMAIDIEKILKNSKLKKRYIEKSSARACDFDLSFMLKKYEDILGKLTRQL